MVAAAPLRESGRPARRTAASTSKPVSSGKTATSAVRSVVVREVHPDVTAPAARAPPGRSAPGRRPRPRSDSQRDACSVHWFRYSRRKVFSCAGISFARAARICISSSERKSPSAGFAFCQTRCFVQSAPGRRLVENRQERRIDAPGSPAPSSRARRAPRGSNAGRSRPSRSPGAAAASARPSTSRARHTAADRAPRAARRRSPSTGIEAVLTVRLGRDRAVETARSPDGRSASATRRCSTPRRAPDRSGSSAPRRQTPARPGPGRPRRE